MHEGIVSTELGLKGMPSLSEEIIISRDLDLLEYAGGRIHFSTISTSKSVELIRKAKRKKMHVTCDVAIINLIFDDTSVGDFDTNFKLNPPLRTKNDIKALLRGIEDGTIDAIVSAHSPQDSESKNLEFGLADFGATGLQTMLHALGIITEEIPLELLIEKITQGPRTVLGLKNPRIEEKTPAELTVFDPSLEWVYNELNNKSKSINSPFWKQKLRGKVLATFNNKKVYRA
jgi:dihydroorotase